MSNLGAKLSAELKGDRVIWMIVGLLAILSVLVVYSATGALAFKERSGDTEFFLLKHGLIVTGGLFLTYLAYLMHYMKYNKVAPYLMAIAVPLLIYTLAFGSDINDAKRWIEVPFIGVSFQTSDFAKMALIIYVAREITKKQEYIKDFNSAFLPLIVPVIIVCGLIAPADLGTAVIVFVTCIFMVFIGRVALKYLFLLLLLGIVVFAFLVILGRFIPNHIRVDTWTSRVEQYLNEEDGGYQIQQAKIAIANGGILGRGPGNSTQRNHLPSAYADFIYSIIWEEYGMLGGLLVLGLYLLLLFRAVRLVTISPKAFGAMLAIGLSLSLALQAMVNIAVNVHLVPVTGVTLPMLSLGGTSIIFTCLAFGMILSVSKHIEQLKQQQDQQLAAS
jgi:cell division protein FtsW